MPLLGFGDLIRMLSDPAITCPECGRETHQNYCRQCDEFFRIGHAPGCMQHSEHGAHRIYPSLPSLPFPTDPSDWALFLSVLRQKHVWVEHAAIRAQFGETLGTTDYEDTFMDMGDRALDWADKTKLLLNDGKVYRMHFADTETDLRIGVLGGQLVMFMPRAEIEGQ